MLPCGSRIGVAVSGGADSVALLHVLQRLAQDREWSLQVLHFNHQLRGAESDEDCRFVETLAASLGLPCRVGAADVRAASAGANLEQTARQLRYGFFRQMRMRHRLDAVATGHTATDQAETVMMRLLRGAAPDSLAGIRPVNDGWIVRPLLEVTRDQVRAWLRAEGLGWREDSSNAENCYDRNRLRGEILPLLRERWNPKAEYALARLARLAARDEAYWRVVVDMAWKTIAAPHRYGVVLNAKRLRAEHPAIQARLLKRACLEVADAAPRLTNEHIDGLLRLVAQPEGNGRLSLPGLNAWRSFSQILLYEQVVTISQPEPVTLCVPGRAALDSTGPEIEARRAEISADAYNEDSSWLDGSLAPGPFRLRPWRMGDRCGPAGQRRESSLHVFLQRRRIPAWERISWPVLEWQGQVVWARGLGVAIGWRAGSGCTHPIEIAEGPPAVWR